MIVFYSPRYGHARTRNLSHSHSYRQPFGTLGKISVYILPSKVLGWTSPHRSLFTSFTFLLNTHHQGVWENDDVRKDDSFNTFEEIFEIATERKADLVLLGGDLFHDNKPSRSTVVRAMDTFSRHCLSDNPITFNILSDQQQNFTTG